MPPEIVIKRQSLSLGPGKAKHLLAAMALRAAVQPGAKLSFELPPSLSPDGVAVWAKTMYAEDQAGTFAPIPSVGLHDVAALRPDRILKFQVHRSPG